MKKLFSLAILSSIVNLQAAEAADSLATDSAAISGCEQRERLYTVEELMAGPDAPRVVWDWHDPRMYIQCRAIHSLVGLQDIANVSQIDHLFLDYNKLKVLSPGIFTSLTALKYLHLSGNLIEKIKPGTFAGLNALLSLNLSNNKLEEMNSETFAGLTALKVLTLEGNKIKKIHPETFVCLKALEYLNLAKNGLTNIHSRAFAGLPALQTLRLREYSFDDLAMMKVQHPEYFEPDPAEQASCTLS